MKVSELIDKLYKCDFDAEVEFAYASDNTTNGDTIKSVAQCVFFGDKEEKTVIVQLRV